MKNKRILNKPYFRHSQWFQLAINYSISNYTNIFRKASFILEDLHRQKKVTSWFFLNKKNKILYKIKLSKISQNNILGIEEILRKHKGLKIKIGTFEPESFQFGGDVGWEIAEKYFHALSVMLFKNNVHKRKKMNVGIIVMFDLILRAVSDNWETWDILQRLKIIRGMSNTKSVKNRKKSKYYRDIMLLIDSPTKYYFNKIQNKELIRNIIRLNSHVVKVLNTKKFFLLEHIRKILPYYVIYIFNMLLLSYEEQKEIISTLEFFLNRGKYNTQTSIIDDF